MVDRDPAANLRDQIVDHPEERTDPPAAPPRQPRTGMSLLGLTARVLIGLVGVAGLLGLGVGGYWAFKAVSRSFPQQTQSATTATPEATHQAQAIPQPLRVEIVNSPGVTTTLPTTTQDPIRVTVNPVYQFETPNGQQTPRYVPYPGAPYVPPVRTPSIDDPRFQYTDVWVAGPTPGSLIPITKEKAVQAEAPIMLRPVDAQSPAANAPTAPEPVAPPANAPSPSPPSSATPNVTSTAKR